MSFTLFNVSQNHVLKIGHGLVYIKVNFDKNNKKKTNYLHNKLNRIKFTEWTHRLNASRWMSQ